MQRSVRPVDIGERILKPFQFFGSNLEDCCQGPEHSLRIEGRGAVHGLGRWVTVDVVHAEESLRGQNALSEEEGSIS